MMAYNTPDMVMEYSHYERVKGFITQFCRFFHRGGPSTDDSLGVPKIFNLRGFQDIWIQGVPIFKIQKIPKYLTSSIRGGCKILMAKGFG